MKQESDFDIEMNNVDGSQKTESQSISNVNSNSNSAENLADIPNSIIKIDNVIEALQSICTGLSEHMKVINQSGGIHQFITWLGKLGTLGWGILGWGGLGLSYLDQDHDYVSPDAQKYVAVSLVGVVPVFAVGVIGSLYLNFCARDHQLKPLESNYSDIKNNFEHDLLQDLTGIYNAQFQPDSKAAKLVSYIKSNLEYLVVEQDKIAYISRLYNASKASILLLNIMKGCISSAELSDDKIQCQNIIKNFKETKYAMFFKPKEDDCDVDIEAQDDQQFLLKK